MDILAALLLAVIGLTLLLAELFFVPGTTVVGLLGFAFATVGVWFGFQFFGPFFGTLYAFAVLTIGLVMTWVASRKLENSQFALKNKLSGSVETPDLSPLRPGDSGIALSALRPSGNAEFGGSVYQVWSYGKLVEEGKRISILKIEGTRIIVSEPAKHHIAV
ncbi:MAG: NfeD family protein [Bacteroidota bacterium]